MPIGIDPYCLRLEGINFESHASLLGCRIKGAVIGESCDVLVKLRNIGNATFPGGEIHAKGWYDVFRPDIGRSFESVLTTKHVKIPRIEREKTKVIRMFAENVTTGRLLPDTRTSRLEIKMRAVDGKAIDLRAKVGIPIDQIGDEEGTKVVVSPFRIFDKREVTRDRIVIISLFASLITLAIVIANFLVSIFLRR